MTSPTRLQVLQALKQARSFIAAGWTKSVNARNAQGDPVEPWADSASSFCLYGAANRACGVGPHCTGPTPGRLLVAVREALGDTTYTDSRRLLELNDTAEDAQPILAVYDAAIERVTAELAA